MKHLAWRGCAITEHHDGSATVLFRTSSQPMEWHLSPHVWQDVVFEVQRATGYAARMRDVALDNAQRARAERYKREQALG